MVAERTGEGHGPIRTAGWDGGSWLASSQMDNGVWGEAGVGRVLGWGSCLISTESTVAKDSEREGHVHECV
jgi:hypothetical protein